MKRVLSILMSTIMLLTIVSTGMFSLVSFASQYDTPSTARQISVNQTYSDNFYQGEEKDYFKFTINQNGYVTVDIRHDYYDPSDVFCWYYVYDSDFKKLSIEQVNHDDVYTTTYMLGLPSGTYYIEVNKGYNVPASIIYNIKVNYKNESNWETEINDTWQKADAISLNKNFYGAFTSNGRSMSYTDTDFYKFTLSNSGSVNVEFRHDYYTILSGSVYAWIHFYDSDMNELFFRVQVNCDKSVVNFPVSNLKKGTYYIEVKNTGNLIGIPKETKYSLSVNAQNQNGSVAAPSSLKATPPLGTTKKVSLSWSKVSGATGYVVYKYFSSSGTYSKVKTVSGTSCKVTGLNPGTKYKFAVKAYKTVNGTTYYSKCSPIATTVTRTEKPSITKISSPASKQVKLVWNKVAGASKYNIYWSKDGSNFKKAGSVTGTSATIKNLPGNKRVYIKMTAINSMNYRSDFSVQKRVIVKQ